MEVIVGIGLDLVDVGRVGRLLDRRRTAEARLFTAEERAYCRSCANASERFAARFAAKEAVGKALGMGVVNWQDIEVSGDGRPTVRLTGGTAGHAAGLGVCGVRLSLTHTEAYAAAVAVAVAEYCGELRAGAASGVRAGGASASTSPRLGTSKRGPSSRGGDP